MRRSSLVTCALLLVATSGCDRAQELVDRVRGRFQSSPPPPAAQPPTPDPSGAAAPQPAAPAAATPAPRPQVSGPRRPLEDEPYVSADTGTIAPGMTESEVYALWGPPVLVRHAGEWTYLFFRNGCEYSCGTHDLVFLHNGVVVDAIVRWWGHGYAGQSSSPPHAVPMPTRGGDTLIVAPPVP